MLLSLAMIAVLNYCGFMKNTLQNDIGILVRFFMYYIVASQDQQNLSIQTCGRKFLNDLSLGLIIFDCKSPFGPAATRQRLGAAISAFLYI